MTSIEDREDFLLDIQSRDSLEPDGTNARVTPIAVIGMSCPLPGGIETPARQWTAQHDRADLVTQNPQ